MSTFVLLPACRTTPTFLLELPLAVNAGQAKRLRAHFETARCLYNALLGEARKRLQQMRTDPTWQEARAIPQAQKQERKEAFSRLRQAYGFSEYPCMSLSRRPIVAGSPIISIP